MPCHLWLNFWIRAVQISRSCERNLPRSSLWLYNIPDYCRRGSEGCSPGWCCRSPQSPGGPWVPGCRTGHSVVNDSLYDSCDSSPGQSTDTSPSRCSAGCGRGSLSSPGTAGPQRSGPRPESRGRSGGWHWLVLPSWCQRPVACSTRAVSNSSYRSQKNSLNNDKHDKLELQNSEPTNSILRVFRFVSVKRLTCRLGRCEDSFNVLGFSV